MAKTNNIDEILSPKRVYCTPCGKDKPLREFYSSKQEIHNNEIYHKKYPICKQCIKKKIYNENTGQLDKSEFKKMLQKLDLPFKNDIYLTALEDKRESFGTYISLLNTAFAKKQGMMCWADGETEEKEIQENQNNRQIINSIMGNQAIDKNDLTKLIDKWGFGYKEEEYIAFERKYLQLKNNYSEITAMHTEALLKYIRYSCKEEMATAEGNVDEAKKWGDMANKAATNAKINPSQLSKADLSDGLSTFSELSQAIEKEIDIIPILPRFKYRPNDALDFNIWCYVNYERDLAGLPPSKYEDVYAFYDKRKKEYVEQYGDPYNIFTDDTSEKNRENIKKFIEEDDKNGSEE